MDKRMEKEKLRSQVKPNSLNTIEEGWMKDVYEAEFEDNREVIYFYRNIECERHLSTEERQKSEKLAFEKINSETTATAPTVKEETDRLLRCAYLEGKNWESSNEDKMEDAGGNLASIHQVEFDGYGNIRDREYSDWRNFLEYFLRSMKKRSQSRLADKGIINLEDKLRQQEFTEKPVLCHGDYHPWNLIYGKNQIYTLDCEYSFSGTKSYDITRALINLNEKALRKKFLSGYRGRAGSLEIENQDFYMLLHATRGLIDGKNLSKEHLISRSRAKIKSLI